MPSLRAVYTEAVYQTVEPLEVKQAKGKMYDYLRKQQSLVFQIFLGKKKGKKKNTVASFTMFEDYQAVQFSVHIFGL